MKRSPYHKQRELEKLGDKKYYYLKDNDILKIGDEIKNYSFFSNWTTITNPIWPCLGLTKEAAYLSQHRVRRIKLKYLTKK